MDGKLENLLLRYATGDIELPLSSMVASHLTICPESRSYVEDLEDLGGCLLDNLEPCELGNISLDKIFEAAPIEETCEEQQKNNKSNIIPFPLLKHMKKDLDKLDWEKYTEESEVCFMETNSDKYICGMFRLKKGCKMEAHSHEQNEYMFVLEGGFSDESGHYGRGDICIAEKESCHTVIADNDQDCICFVVLEKAA